MGMIHLLIAESVRVESEGGKVLARSDQRLPIDPLLPSPSLPPSLIPFAPSQPSATVASRPL